MNSTLVCRPSSPSRQLRLPGRTKFNGSQMSWVTVASRSSGNRCWERSMTMMHFVSTLSIGTCTSRFLTLCGRLDTVFLDAVNVRRVGSRQPITPNSEFIFRPCTELPATLPLSLSTFSNVSLSFASQTLEATLWRSRDQLAFTKGDFSVYLIFDPSVLTILPCLER